VANKKNKLRLDLLVAQHYPHLSLNQIQSFILQGKVRINQIIITKAGTPTATDSIITLTGETPKYVSRAGLKLEGALEAFKFNVADLVVLDAGISTGGFTDCLLQHGAKKVYGVDVGYGQVHEKIRRDSRVVIMEKTNLRLLNSLPEKVDLVTLDLSFISLLKVIPAISKALKPMGKVITLIKPQFEANREDVKPGGRVTEASVHQKIIEKIKLGMEEFGYTMINVIDSPITGATSKNKEFLALFLRNQ